MKQYIYQTFPEHMSILYRTQYHDAELHMDCGHSFTVSQFYMSEKVVIFVVDEELACVGVCDKCQLQKEKDGIA